MAAPSLVLGHSPGGVGQSSRRRLPPPIPSIPTQSSSSKVDKSSEEHESSNDVDYHQLLKDYHEVQAVLSATRLNVKMLHGQLDASRDTLQASMTEFSKLRVN